MLFLRFVVIIAAFVIAVSIGAGIFTCNRKYFKVAWKVFLATLVASVLFFAVLIAERVMVAV
jgi:hypothetical protein